MAFAYSPKIVTDGLVFAVDAANTKSYPGSGTTWKDLSGNGNDGTLTNGPTFDSGNGGSIVFDGGNDYTPFPYNTLYNFQYDSSFTIDSWVYINENSNYGYIITNRNTDASGVKFSGFGLAHLNGSIRGFIGGFNSTSAWRQVEISTSDFNLYVYQKWVYISYTNTGIAGEQKIYINGVDRSTGAVDGTNPPYTVNYDSDHQVTIGASPADGTPAGHYLNAKISNIRMYTKALTPSEITQNYNALKSRFGL